MNINNTNNNYYIDIFQKQIKYKKWKYKNKI